MVGAQGYLYILHADLAESERHSKIPFSHFIFVKQTFLSWVFPLHCFSAGSRPPLILQSPPPYAVSPREGGPDQKQQAQLKKKGPAVKEEKDMYDIVSSPNKDSTKLTLKLSRVKSNESDPPSK